MKNDDMTLHTYQDDLDTEKPDEFMNEAGESPAEELGIPEAEMKRELDNIALDDLEHDNDDMRETIEDRDEDDDNGASRA